MTNYPVGTWEGDPRAPWNAPDPEDYATCGDCAFAAWLPGVCLVCLQPAMECGECEISRVEDGDAACDAWRAA